MKDVLPGLVPALLPTPTVNGMGAGKTPEQWDEWAARQKAADGRPAPHGKSLEQEAIRLLPTPKATNNDNQQNLDRYGPNLGMALMPEQFEWTSDPTPQPSNDGPQPWDEPPLPLPNPAATDAPGSTPDLWSS